MDSEFEQITCDILADPRFQETRSFLHHGGENSVYPMERLPHFTKK